MSVFSRPESEMEREWKSSKNILLGSWRSCKMLCLLLLVNWNSLKKSWKKVGSLKQNWDDPNYS